MITYVFTKSKLYGILCLIMSEVISHNINDSTREHILAIVEETETPIVRIENLLHIMQMSLRR